VAGFIPSLALAEFSNPAKPDPRRAGKFEIRNPKFEIRSIGLDHLSLFWISKFEFRI
jgi:hypothetical protein